ncbi:MAG TPA: DUF3375 domain-containing protein [Deltaproteobacteria bacterium]|nr:DUF3375 domain-containing protein [Deltaproteobacteria bacterium]
MSLDYDTLEILRQNHPAWRLLTSPHAPLIASFLHQTFLTPNVRVLPQAALVETLEDRLFALNQTRGVEAFPRAAADYLNEWAEPDKGWLRKFYRKDSDEVQFDLTPAAEKAVAWLESLSETTFIGTESRLKTLFELLRQIHEGSEFDPQIRLAELQKRRAAIDAEIAQVQAGHLPLLDDTALKDRFLQFQQLARELLGDFRQVEHNFRALDRQVRERIALWQGKKGELLEEVLGERDSIADSDQGKSFRAFWDFLMSAERQDEFTRRLEHMLALPAVCEMHPERRLRRIHYDWLEAGEHTQRTVAQLSQQLRRFLDDQAWLENRRIMEILRDIEAQALALRGRADGLPRLGMTLEESAADIALPFERPLFRPERSAKIADAAVESGDETHGAEALYSQIFIDKAALAQHIRRSLQEQAQISLSELCKARPLRQGLAELVAYLELAGDGSDGERTFLAVTEETREESIRWDGPDGAEVAGSRCVSTARLSRLVYLRAAAVRGNE